MSFIIFIFWVCYIYIYIYIMFVVVTTLNFPVKLSLFDNWSLYLGYVYITNIDLDYQVRCYHQILHWNGEIKMATHIVAYSFPIHITTITANVISLSSHISFLIVFLSLKYIQYKYRSYESKFIVNLWKNFNSLHPRSPSTRPQIKVPPMLKFPYFFQSVL